MFLTAENTEVAELPTPGALGAFYIKTYAGFGRTASTLAERLTVTAVGPVEDFQLQAGVACRDGHTIKRDG